MAARLSRRAALTGAAGVPLLAGCAGDGGTPSGSASGSATQTPTPTPTPSTSATPGPTRSPKPAESLTAAKDVPVGGGRVLSAEEVVVTQPAAGEFRAFSSTCTHSGCAVGDVADRTINCPCHGSRFSIEDGSVVTGPATEPLPAVAVRETGGQVIRA
ncbi:Rieske (2Fe-2S) protein [Nocardioides pyridinolyticus]